MPLIAACRRLVAHFPYFVASRLSPLRRNPKVAASTITQGVHMIRFVYASPAIALAAILCIASVPEAFSADLTVAVSQLKA
jgi:hypothetical protein